MSSAAADLVLAAGGITAALLTIGGVIWWLVWPRIEDKLQQLVSGVHRVEGKLSDDVDSVGRYARVAAGAAAELPAIRDQLTELAATQATQAGAQADVERWRLRADARLSSVEAALLALLGPELRRRLFLDLSTDENPNPPHPERPDL